MTYWFINIWFLLAALAVAAVALLFSWRPSWRAMLGAVAVVLVLTAIFDNAIIGFGIVDYDPEKISGVRLGVAPIEDFAYTLAAAMIVPAVWAWWGRRDRNRS